MAIEKKYKWHKIAESVDDFFWQDTNLCEITVQGKTICIARKQQELFACTNKCPHASGHLANGTVDAFGNIVCPLHRYKFSLHTGRNTSGEGYYLKTYNVEKREDGIFIGFEDGGLFGLFK